MGIDLLAHDRDVCVVGELSVLCIIHVCPIEDKVILMYNNLNLNTCLEHDFLLLVLCTVVAVLYCLALSWSRKSFSSFLFRIVPL